MLAHAAINPKRNYGKLLGQPSKKAAAPDFVPPDCDKEPDSYAERIEMGSQSTLRK